jgi:uncharacterized membrane protein
MIPFNDQMMGIVYILIGLILTIFALGLFKTFLSLIVIIISIGLIVYGTLKTKYHQRILDALNKK